MSKFFSLLSLSVLVFAIGCESGPSLVPAGGTVLVDDKPMEGVTVLFIPGDSEGMPASGITDASGKFKLTTLVKDDGAVVGGYNVAVSKNETVGGIKVPENVDMNNPKEVDAIYKALDKAGRDTKTKSLIAPKYMNVNESGLTAIVSKDASTNQYEFKVQSK